MVLTSACFSKFTSRASVNLRHKKRDDDNTVPFIEMSKLIILLLFSLQLLALLLLPLLPWQKDSARERMVMWPTHSRYAKITIAMTCVAWVYSVTMNMLAMFPQTQCLEFVGGQGC